jgi:Zn-dependent M28 family amino/carboxypeptidase
MKAKQIIGILLIVLMVVSIGYVSFFSGGPSSTTPTPPQPSRPAQPARAEVAAPVFDEDQAYEFIKKQVSFGPRVPNTKAHKDCANWYVETLKGFDAQVTVQEATLKAFDGTPLQMKNIIASYQPEKKERILLCAHWDTRPFADKDPTQALWNKPIEGANDGGSGVGVLLEIARQLQMKPTNVGIDIIFFDAEDYGSPEFDKGKEYINPGYQTSWCLGSQYFAKNLHVHNYNPRFGILLDMVGASDAMFNKDDYSVGVANDVVNLVWNTAGKLGYGSYFPHNEINGVIDDHVMLGNAGIRCIDIIDTRPHIAAMGLGSYQFGSYHHTHKDNMDIIDRNTLKAVGQTVMQVIYNQ